MDPVTRAVLLSWEWRAEVVLPLILLAVLYVRGWRHLRRRTRPARLPYRLANGWRLAAYLGGLLVILLALVSPIDVLGGQLFFMHMIQHLLLVMIAPPLLMLANPLPFILWGLPQPWRRAAGGWLSSALHRESRFRRLLRSATGPGTVWLLYVIFLLGWHDPNLYNAALRNQFVHDVEHLTFFLPAMLYWWHVVGAGPRIHRQFSMPGRIAYNIAAIPPTMFTGIAIAFAEQPIYSYYLSVPRPWSLDVLSDQRISGVIMWIPGSMMYMIAVLLLAARWLRGEENKPPLPVAKWATDERMAAPGLDRS
jgi:cytochrome c oxidase assembly factor CtaG